MYGPPTLWLEKQDKIPLVRATPNSCTKGHFTLKDVRGKKKGKKKKEQEIYDKLLID